MATTSIWAVKGWLGKVVLYIENPDKTDNPKFYRQEELTDVQTQSLSDVIDYAVRAEKTTVTPDDESAMVVRQFISGINCLPSTARDRDAGSKKAFRQGGRCNRLPWVSVLRVRRGHAGVGA